MRSELPRYQVTQTDNGDGLRTHVIDSTIPDPHGLGEDIIATWHAGTQADLDEAHAYADILNFDGVEPDALAIIRENYEGVPINDAVLEAKAEAYGDYTDSDEYWIGW